jgi:diadenosine tetraphosphatase ApaH/serine/threonine PP2A family protein phosphatase
MCAVVDNPAFCVHGRIGPRVTTLDHIGRFEWFQEVPDDGPMCDLLWSDSEAKVGDSARSNHGETVLWGL